jgi:hypothetical protein
MLCLSSCQEKASTAKAPETVQTVSNDLLVDHFNIWVTSPTEAKNRLTEIGFTALPDSLSAIHAGQGTAGRYFYFLNIYLELIFVNDQNELEENNAENKDLDFTERANFAQSGASPFSIALKVKDYDVEKIPFEKVRYHQEWMDEHASIYAALNSKTHLAEPSLFVVYPELESDRFETMDDLQNIPEDYAIFREFFKHPNGAQKVSNIVITSIDLDLETETMKAVNALEDVTIQKGPAHLMEIYFDDNIQQKSFDLRPELPLIVYI